MNLNKLAKNILRDNIYLSLSTCAQNRPWIAPVFYHVGRKNELYFASMPTSVHCQNIAKNPRIAFAIFDSHQKEETGVGIQASGKAQILDDRSQILEALKYYHTDFFKITVASFMGKSKYRLYKITPTVFYLNDPRVKTDRRVEVNLQKCAKI